MIDIKITKDNIKIDTGKLSDVFSSDRLPLKFLIKSTISKEIKWEVSLSDYMWASYPNNQIYDVVVLDSQNNFVYKENYDVLKHGSTIHKFLYLYCKNLINNNKRPKGLAIGTHDGEFGEWVPLIKNYLSDIILVEGSEKQYEKLKTNYVGIVGITTIHDIITPNGGEVNFFEGGKGYTNSVVERVIRNWESEEISSSVRNSKSLSTLLDEIDKIDWLHLDVEGLDVKLLMSINDTTKLPPLIIYENNNLIDEEKIFVNNWFNIIGYEFFSEDNMTMMIRKNEYPSFNWGHSDEWFKNVVSFEIFHHRIYERFFKVDEGDIVFDFGSSIGPFTYSVINRKPKQIYCVEPSETLYPILLSNTSHGPVTHINMAIGNVDDKDGEFFVFMDGKQGEMKSVKSVTFKKLIDKYNIDKIDFIKTDCEGGEYDIFNEENFDWIKNNVKKVVGEWHLGDENLKNKFRNFRDKYLKNLPNHQVFSVDNVDIKWNLWSDDFINYYTEVIVYIDNRQ